MSRSRKRSPVLAFTTAKSEKADKQEAHRFERRLVRQILRVAPETEVLPLTRELRDVWGYAKDGRYWCRECRRPSDMRK